MSAAGRSGIGQTLAVLEEVARSGPAASANGIARALGIPRATAYRLINSLVADEYLLRHPELPGFLLGVRVVELAHLVAPAHADPTQDTVAGVRAATGAAVHLVRYRDGRVVVADEDPTMPLRSLDRTRLQLGSTAIGRLLLAAYGPPFAGHTDRAAVMTVTTTAAASGITAREHRDIAASVAEVGFAAYAEAGPSARACIAVPLRSGGGRIHGALALATPSGDPEVARSHLDALFNAADRLSQPGGDRGTRTAVWT
ncbi:IclR family transcriptional regulator [Agromyces sp. LHK192]|uniref:IclR family transcriptional regulator n=1 Tax=Agromyces sp. LHK192 TaxID=2498704 RepID=UPI0013E3E19A|nr:helix-turn-helix domain-containing protein [Agromyces sp. LHK192]